MQHAIRALLVAFCIVRCHPVYWMVSPHSRVIIGQHMFVSLKHSHSCRRVVHAHGDTFCIL